MYKKNDILEKVQFYDTQLEFPLNKLIWVLNI